MRLSGVLCNDEDLNECEQEHIILHSDFVKPKVHMFTVRNTDAYDINWNKKFPLAPMGVLAPGSASKRIF